jgi:hypothetical protein
MAGIQRQFRLDETPYRAAQKRAEQEGLNLNAIVGAFITRYASGRDSLDAVPGHPVLRADIDGDTVRIIREIWSKPPGERYAARHAEQTIAEWDRGQALAWCAGLLSRLTAQ